MPRGPRTARPLPLLTRVGMVVLALLAGSAGLVAAAAPANADVLGSITVTYPGQPNPGTPNTLFGGVIADAQCPESTTDSFFVIVGDDLPFPNGFLGQGPVNGRGRVEFVGASIANTKTANSGSFSSDGDYTIRFDCIAPDGSTSAMYTATLRYKVANGGTFTIVTAAPSPTPTGTGSPTPTATSSTSPSPTASGTETESPTPTPTDTATETPSPTPTDTATPSPTPTTSVSDDSGAVLGTKTGSGGSGALANTGARVGGISLLALLLIALGTLLYRYGKAHDWPPFRGRA